MSLYFELYTEVYIAEPDLWRISVFETNITHNLGRMAEEAGIYNSLWCGEEMGYTAGDIIQKLTIGLEDMKTRPSHYKQFDSQNGWGLYKHFVPWVEEVLNACKKYPKCKIEVSK